MDWEKHYTNVPDDQYRETLLIQASIRLREAGHHEMAEDLYQLGFLFRDQRYLVPNELKRLVDATRAAMERFDRDPAAFRPAA